MLCFYLIACVQIIVESFPVSSSGHCFLLTQFLKNSEKFFLGCADFLAQRGIYSLPFLQSFDHVLHLVTLVILAFFFFDRWKIYIIRLKRCLPIFFKAAGLAALADIVTASLYMIFKTYPIQLPLVVRFCITAVSLISLFFIQNDGRKSFTPQKAFLLGLVQGIALLPGISRLATTYTAARWLGLQPRKAFEVSWLIAVPLFLAASAQGIYKIVHMPEVHHLVFNSLIYILGASIVSYIALKISAYLFYTNRAWWFGVYMLLPICLALKYMV